MLPNLLLSALTSGKDLANVNKLELEYLISFIILASVCLRSSLISLSRMSGKNLNARYKVDRASRTFALDS